MNAELKLLLTLLAVAAPLGLIGGIIIRKAKPDWCRAYAKACLDRKGWLFAVCVLMFGGLAIAAFVIGRPYFGAFFLVFAGFEAVVMLLFGFRRLTPEKDATD